jgi:tryptophan synthase beta chain
MRRAIQDEWLVPRMWYNIVPDLPKPLPPKAKWRPCEARGV